MKTNQIILTGSQASGKTYTANVITSLLDETQVLFIEARVETVVGILRKLKKHRFKAIVFDECIGIDHIKHLMEVIPNSLKKEEIPENFIYTTSDDSFSTVSGFKVLKCKYK